MRYPKPLFVMVIITAVLFTSSCNDQPAKPIPERSELNTSDNFQYAATTPAKGQLGRTLFYDKALSMDNSVACADCHKQSRAFADDERFSTGIDGQKTDRNSPPIQNLQGAFVLDGFEEPFIGSGQALFWDGRTRSLHDMVLQPVSNHIEMGLRSPSDLKSRLSSIGYYKQLFNLAYGDEEITLNRISESLAGFVASITSKTSPFMESMFTTNSAELLSIEAQRGFDLFFTKYDCQGCHDIVSNQGYSEPAGEEFSNIGLDMAYDDKGRGGQSGNPNENGSFRIPNLRNIALTAPYMHDGRFSSLEQVIDHYSNSVKNHPNLDQRLLDETGNPLVLNITKQEKADLVAFLNSLTDQGMVQDERFSDPFD